MDSNMNEYIPPRPRSRRPSVNSNKMVRFPSIQELEKNVHPPGNTPRSSVTDFPWDKDINDETAWETAEDYTNNNTQIDEIQEIEEIEELDDADSDADSSPPQLSSVPSPPPTIQKNLRIQSSYRYQRSYTFPNPAHSAVSSTHATVCTSTETLFQSQMKGAVRQQDAPQSRKASSQKFIRRRQPSMDIVSARPPSTELEFPPYQYPYNDMMASKLAYQNRPSLKLVPSMSIAASMKNNHFPRLESVLGELKGRQMVFDRGTAIAALKARIMKGEHVSYDEIFAIKRLNLRMDQKHLGWRLPWSMDLYCEKGLVYIPTPNKPMPAGPNTFGTLDDLRILLEDDITDADEYGRRRYHLNLAGFKDEEISLYLEGKNRLVIRAVRNQNHGDGHGTNIHPPAIITETIILPPDLKPDNLRIVRKPSGTTIIEESWRF